MHEPATGDLEEVMSRQRLTALPAMSIETRRITR
jgi:hypothetical protein